ncbi:fimbrillin family protein [Segatella copri]|uniref:fimbrillin family protein n=1 Tax=Segatella copri TaxID=165179 RepID=UPI001C4948A5|nr:fimbrillin family protein [Segatella copri]MBW0049802.1 fimbrillin family protein [Segatella copri]
MKIMKRMMGLAAAILALSACSESEDLLSAFHSDPNAVRITAQVGKASANGFTRSNPLGATEADQKKFNENDEISVQADGQDAVTYQLVGSEWQPQGNKFLKWESNEMNFTAYYPASFDGNLNNVTLPKEYDEASLAANDFMSYSGKQSNTNGNQLTLTMNRMMARVVVEIDGFNDQYAGATVNSLSICGIKAYKHTDKKFYALIKPCEAQNSATFLSLDVAEGESKTTTETLTGIPTLTAGNSYTYKLKVGKNKISVSGIYVADWTGGTIAGGKTEECPTPYVTFTANGEQKFMMTTEGDYTFSNLEYSVNNSEWASVAIGTEIPFGGDKGDLRLRGINPNGTATAWDVRSTITFTANVNVACTGDIRTLQDWRNYNIVETNNARFCKLFNGCSVLTSAPELPATTLAENCYYCMFEGCTSLTSAPELKATTLANSCYYSMFIGCTSLTSAPELPATELENHCYSTMFENCTSLKSAPELPAKKLASYCYYEMFDGCTSLESAPVLPATELAEACYCKMFNSCKNLSSVTMLAPSDKIKDTSDSFNYWLGGAAGTSATSRKLIVLDEAAYNALETNSDYLPAIWKKDQCTVEYYTPKP